MKTNLTIRIGLITGVISATVVQIVFLLFDVLNTRFGWGIPLSSIRGITGIFSIVFLGIGIYVGMQKNKTLNGGTITWGRAVLVGAIIALITAIISALGTIVFNYLNPDFSERIVKDTTALVTTDVRTPEQIEASADAIRKEFSPSMLIIQAFTGQLMGGILISLVMAIFVKRNIHR